MDDLLDERPTLRAWIGEYAEIEREYEAALRDWGVEFGRAGEGNDEVRRAKERVRAKGALFRNGGASISTGALSSACRACSDGLGSKTFVLSLRCNRNCYFCFNANQDEGVGREAGVGAGCEGRDAGVGAWRREVDEFAAACGDVTHVGLSGGEPLLHRREAVEFVRYVRAHHPGAHVRIYTAGDFLDEDVLAELRDAGLDELRMSVKLDVLDVERADAIIDDALAVLARAKRFIPDVMVEMPVIPGTAEPMRRLLVRLDELGAFGINLLEFGFPMSDWAQFARRGFKVKNPPFSVVYDYAYPAGLPIEGSELLCLELLEFAMDEGLALGVHYCSLENKNRGQVYRQNAALTLDSDLYEFDQEDFFYKCAKVFDGDVEPVRARLIAEDAPFEADEQEGSLLLHPRWIGALDDAVLPALSYNVVEHSSGGFAIRELKIEPIERKRT